MAFEAEITALGAASVDAFVVHTRRGDLLVRAATRDECAAHVRATVRDRTKQTTHDFALAESCVVSPGRAELRALFARMPGLPTTIAEDVLSVSMGKPPATGTLVVEADADAERIARDEAAAALATLTTKHAGEDIVEFETRGGSLFAKVPDSATYAKLRAQQTEEPAKLLELADEFCARCVVWPEPARARALLSRFPSLSGLVARDMVAVAGGRDATTGKVHAL